MLSRRPRGGRGFRRDAAGASALEFALLLPIMLVLWAGMAEMSHAIGAWRRVTLLARTVADLTSKGDTVDPIASGTMSDILAASTAVLRPYASTDAAIVVSALGVTQATDANPRVCSSIANAKGTARKTGVATDLAVPQGYGVANNRYLLAEVTLPYAPMIGSAFTNLIGGLDGTITLRTSFAWPVRSGFTHNSTIPEVVMPKGSPC